MEWTLTGLAMYYVMDIDLNILYIEWTLTNLCRFHEAALADKSDSRRAYNQNTEDKIAILPGMSICTRE